MVTRTRQGRRATKVAYEHLGLKWAPPRDGANGSAPLFDDEPQPRRDARVDKKDDRKP
jgi:hypothetical protein